jgi:hypothetical protein
VTVQRRIFKIVKAIPNKTINKNKKQKLATKTRNYSKLGKEDRK